MSDYGKVSNFVLLNAVRISDRIADSCYNCRTFPRWTYFPFILINEATEVFKFNCYKIHTVHISSAVCSRTLNLGRGPRVCPSMRNHSKLHWSPRKQNCALFGKALYFSLSHTHIRKPHLRRWRFPLEHSVHNMGWDVSGTSFPDADLTSSLLWL